MPADVGALAEGRDDPGRSIRQDHRQYLGEGDGGGDPEQPTGGIGRLDIAGLHRPIAPQDRHRERHRGRRSQRRAEDDHGRIGGQHRHQTGHEGGDGSVRDHEQAVRRERLPPLQRAVEEVGDAVGDLHEQDRPQHRRIRPDPHPDPEEHDRRRAQKEQTDSHVEGEGIALPQGDESVPESPARCDEQRSRVRQKRGEHPGLRHASVTREKPENEPLCYRSDEGSAQNERSRTRFGGHRATAWRKHSPQFFAMTVIVRLLDADSDRQ